MVILGLGSNVGDRLLNLRRALSAIKNLHDVTIQQVSPVYLSDALLPENAPPEWDMPHLNLAIRCKTVLSPHDLLDELKKIEWSIGRKPEMRHWGPRILDIDILAWDDQIIESDRLTVPHANLIDRPFALWPLADVAALWKFPLEGRDHNKTAAELVEKWGSRFTGDAPLNTKQIYQRIDTAQLVGIINITPDSFSDGSEFAADNALNLATNLVSAGAEIIDIGAEATSPNAMTIDAETELKRLMPVLETIKNNFSKFLIPPKISIDTRRVDVASYAIRQKVDWINDVNGFNDPAMRELLSENKQDCVVMHSVSIPAKRSQSLSRDIDVIKWMQDWCEAKLESLQKAGINNQRIILDPGIGFGKLPEHSFELIKQIEIFKKFSVRLLVGHSRKLFLSLFTNYPFPERDVETATIAVHLAKNQVDYIRVHNVEMCARAFRMMKALA